MSEYSNFNKACGNYMKQNPGKVITADLLASMVGQAYPIAFTPVNVLSGFKKTGIYPFNLLMTNNWRHLMLSPLHPAVCLLHWNNQYQKMKCSLCSFLQRRRYIFKLELCRAHTPRAHCAIYIVAFVCMAITSEN